MIGDRQRVAVLPVTKSEFAFVIRAPERIRIRRRLRSFAFSGGGDASCTLNGDVLEIRYSDGMVQSDFENAVYKRAQ